MEKSSYEKMRQYYRIQYPLYYRPKLKISGEDFESDVVELSVYGVRFLYMGSSQLSTGDEIHISMTFHDDESFHLKGELLIIEKEDIILRFKGHIPMNRIMQELIYLSDKNMGIGFL